VMCRMIEEGVDTLRISTCSIALIHHPPTEIFEAIYVAAARAIGASSLRIMFRHILPNVVLSLIVLGTMDAAGLDFRFWD